jgi:hypothetical protein
VGSNVPADVQHQASSVSASLAVDSTFQTPPRLDNLDLSPALTDATRSFDYSMVIGTDILGSGWQGPVTGGLGDSEAADTMICGPSESFGGASDA